VHTITRIAPVGAREGLVRPGLALLALDRWGHTPRYRHEVWVRATATWPLTLSLSRAQIRAEIWSLRVSGVQTWAATLSRSVMNSNYSLIVA